MIERYSRPAMKRVWSEENKCQKWLQVELAACEAWAEEGVIPKSDMELLQGAQYDHRRMMEVFEVTRHDVTAFLTSITDGLGPEGRWLHWGLTSSDMLDTALGLQLGEAGNLLLEDIDDALQALREQAIAHKATVMMGRTHGVHAEPITFGLKLALWWEELRRQRIRLEAALDGVRVGKISGAVGTHATAPPLVEDRVCQKLGLQIEPVSNQVVQRDRHAHFVLTLALISASLEKFATELRSLQRTEIHEVEEPFGQGQTGSSSMPHKRNPGTCRAHLWTGSANPRPQCHRPRERGPLGRTGHQPLFRRKNHSPRFLPGVGLHPQHLHEDHQRTCGSSRSVCGPTWKAAAAWCSASRSCLPWWTRDSPGKRPTKSCKRTLGAVRT